MLRSIITQSNQWIETGHCRSDTKSGFLMESKKKKTMPNVSIQQSDPCVPWKNPTLSTGRSGRIARYKTFLKPTAFFTTAQSTPHHTEAYDSSDGGLTATRVLLPLLLLLLTASQRGTSLSAPANSAYRHPMAVVRATDDLFANCARFGGSRRTPTPQSLRCIG